MKKFLFIPVALCGLLFAVSCIEEDLDACPDEGGGVTVALSVEKFQTRPPYAPADLEERFRDRIHSLNYLLYADGRLIEQGTLDVASGVGPAAASGAAIDRSRTSEGIFLFRHDPLPFGSYRLAFVANAAPQMMEGSTDAPELYYVTYQGQDEGDDHFRGDLNFDVTCPVRNEFESVLRRIYGVARFRFEQIPAEVSAIEVSLDNVGARMPLSGDPDRACQVAERVAVADFASGAAGSFTLGAFPTLPGLRSTWRMKLYGADASEPIYDRIVTDTLRVVSNQLLDLKVRFREGDLDGDIEFTVDLDTTWDGSNEGGGEVSSAPADPNPEVFGTGAGAGLRGR